MATIRLVAIDDAMQRALEESPAALEQLVGGSLGPVAELAGDLIVQTAAYLKNQPREPQWGCFLTIDAATGQVVGTCGYKGGPADDGTVEAAYFTFPPFEGRGFATAMATELRRRAGERRVIAHTLPERNASCRVLEKAGFAYVGEAVDPEDGLVWRWVGEG